MTYTTDVSIPMLKDVKSQAPDAICEIRPTNVNRNLIVNSDKAPFDDPKIRRAMMLTLDRQAFIDILSECHADIGGFMPPPPEGVWGMPSAQSDTIPGRGTDIEKQPTEDTNTQRRK